VESIVTCPSCKRRVSREDNVVTIGVNAILNCPECLTRTEVSNVGRPSFRWTLASGQMAAIRVPPGEAAVDVGDVGDAGEVGEPQS
jgi:hypothetical protein